MQSVFLCVCCDSEYSYSSLGSACADRLWMNPCFCPPRPPHPPFLSDPLASLKMKPGLCGALHSCQSWACAMLAACLLCCETFCVVFQSWRTTKRSSPTLGPTSFCTTTTAKKNVRSCNFIPSEMFSPPFNVKLLNEELKAVFEWCRSHSGLETRWCE